MSNFEYMSEKIHFLNGKFVSEDQLLISPRDLGFSRGYGVCDFLRTYHGRPFLLEQHIDRLFQSAMLMSMSMPWEREEIKNRVQETLEKNTSDEEKYIKIIISGGVSRSIFPGSDPSIVIIIDSAEPHDDLLYKKGATVLTKKYERTTPDAKSTNYTEGVRQLMEAKKTGATECIYYGDLQVFEGVKSNVFALIDGKLLTPKSNVLSGVTREVLLDILDLHVPVLAQDFTLSDLRGASEIFITGSATEILPITSIGRSPVGDGEVGLNTKESMRQFQKYTASDLW